MAELVYISCGLLSLACAAMLIRGYRSSRARLLLWSSVCFVALSVNNVLLFLDRVVYPTIDFSLPRSLAALVGLALLVYALVWETV